MAILMGRLILLLLKFPGKKVSNKILGKLNLCKPAPGVPFSPSTNYQQGICNIGVSVCGAISVCFFFGTVKVPVFVYVWRTLTFNTFSCKSCYKWGWNWVEVWGNTMSVEGIVEVWKFGHFMYALTGWEWQRNGVKCTRRVSLMQRDWFCSINLLFSAVLLNIIIHNA